MLVSIFSLVIKHNTGGYGTTLFLQVKNEVYEALIYAGNVNPIIVKIFQKKSRFKKYLRFCVFITFQI